MVEALMEPEAMQHLAELATQVPAHHAILEIGTHHAANLVNMAQAAKQGHGAHVYGVDAYGSGDVYRGRPHMLQRYTSQDEQIARDHIRANHLVRATTLIVNTSTQAAAEYDGPPIGLLVIDGEHRHHAVINDYQAWKPHLAPNATVAFDDYGGTYGAQVITAVKELGLEVDVIGTRLAVTRRSEEQACRDNDSKPAPNQAAPTSSPNPAAPNTNATTTGTAGTPHPPRSTNPPTGPDEHEQ